MEEETGKPRASNRLLWVLGVVGVLVVAAAVTTAVVVLNRFAEPPAPAALPRDAVPAPLGKRELCGIQLVVYIETDDGMTRAAQALRDDQKARRVLTETKAESYERFKKIFANQPELVKLTTPDALPAAVHLVPVAGTDPEAWANELRRRFPEAKKVDVLDPAGLAAKMKTTLPPCPPEGER
ncbi:permease-like cell division protein FtsX [Amycolatopsis sp. NPDC089917]|uniref:permease-like cell division protein FtsX n=1 Tax=Amycolatopsis sp. NPDC089917 TaxID=3155187 RepID=UPI00341D4F5D